MSKLDFFRLNVVMWFSGVFSIRVYQLSLGEDVQVNVVINLMFVFINVYILIVRLNEK